MPFVIRGSKRGGRVLAIALGAAALMAAPAHAAGTIANPLDCAPDPTLSRAFLGFGDLSQYTPVQDSGVEAGAAGWTLSGGATVVSGNEPWKIGGRSDSRALDLPAGASAITAPICIDRTYPNFRLFTRSLGDLKAPLTIDVLFLDSKGNIASVKPYNHLDLNSAWGPTSSVNINVFTAKTLVAAAPVAFRFTAAKNAHYQIDDVYVDPWARG